MSEIVEPVVVESPVVPPDVAELVEKQVAEALKPIKDNLDKAYAARDEAQKKVQEFEKAQRAAELKKMQEDGKHREAYELQLAEERTLREKAEQRAVELTRDLTLRNALSAKEFRTDAAREMAFREIVSQLVKSADGNWTHSGGKSISDFVSEFSDSEANSFLFKQKNSSGGGSAPIVNSPGVQKSESLFNKSQAEVLKLASEGKLPPKRR